MSLEVGVFINISSKGYAPAFLEKNIQVENGKDLIEKVSAIYEGAVAEGILSKDLENNEYLFTKDNNIILEAIFYVNENEKQFDLLGGTFRPNGDFSVPYSADSLEFEKERIEERFGNFPFDINDLNAPAEEELLDILITYYEKGK